MNGDISNIHQLKAYLLGFRYVIIWGAGNLGSSIGSFLSHLGVVFSYWDQKFESMPELNGAKVLAPFSADIGSDDVLVIFGISNGVISTCLLPKLKTAKHVLMGAELYQRFICPHVAQGEYRPGFCTDSICNVRACDNLDQFLCPEGGDLQIPVLGFVINQKCTLKCKHCSGFMLHFSQKQQVNFPADRVIRDIEMALGAVDSARQVTVYGGEPFLHPDIYEIATQILSHRNFANFSINTNAVCKIDPRVLSIADPRFSISVSDYSDNLSDAQLKVFDTNLSTIKASGVKFRNTKPQWMIPSTFEDRHRSVEQMERMTAECKSQTMCTEVKNGRFYPCAFISAIHALEKYDFRTDYIEIDQAGRSSLALKAALQQCMNRSYYKGCSICDSAPAAKTISAGEQAED